MNLNKNYLDNLEILDSLDNLVFSHLNSTRGIILLL